jgi:hypothetical protein
VSPQISAPHRPRSNLPAVGWATVRGYTPTTLTAPTSPADTSGMSWRRSLFVAGLILVVVALFVVVRFFEFVAHAN